MLIKRNVVISPEWQNHTELFNFCNDIELHIKSHYAEILKDDPAATVVAVPYYDSRLVIKKYNFKNTYKFIMRSIRRSKARKSWDNSTFLSKIGIETQKPVALIEDKIAFLTVRSFFIGTYINGQDARHFFNDSLKTDDERCTAARRVVASLCQYHSKDICIGDTKDKNIIIDPFRVFWVDLEDLSRPRLKWIRNLGELRDWRILLGNLKANPVFQRLIVKEAKEKFNNKVFSRIIRHAAFNAKKKFSIKRFQLQSRLEHKLPFMIMNQVDSIAQGAEQIDWERIPCSGNAIVARHESLHGSLYCKIFLSRSPVEGIKRLFRLSRGARAVRNEQLLRIAGFLVPETLYWRRYKEKDYTITKEVKGISLLSLFKKHRHHPPIKRNLFSKLGEEIALLHMLGFAHGDLRMGNIIVEESGGHFRFVFIDNERTNLFRLLPRRLMIENLRQINTDAIRFLSKTDRLRIFRAYNSFNMKLDRDEQKRWIEKVEQLTKKRLAKSVPNSPSSRSIREI